jgi:hypothetical protein
MEPSDPTAFLEQPCITRVKSRLAEFVADPVIVCLLLFAG